ncbi:membrane protein insertase YidC [Mesorhizobium sp. M1A.F.Ca.IN.020.06.1.1]|uniref:membrane protein insertase YidC n=1 Tax=unclassified Mesorhizobium TaxID=325217 RepID=UPI000BAEAAC7|nr:MULTISPECIES: membrane protein insertase YidC [unclassified Mesorhizobium]PBB30352.1 membrane protein insertase YidC [Mesorhizobium sp. WSM3882]PBB45023.1 membrane protein insertase YidC [Mesorhizobium sp. WSM3866]RUV83774.1 membrane protein insertase YidC [Mesorhizobium sp. M1A.F.Ca.IN.020.32.1.1]RUW07099.1 membrane protein insertase YidC [Mesorhizobium sp. M1A.F.Ca.IN.022.05.2.1]RUW32993.1 membrane protein insertase YidC [Mesorhizobium sp. M1A.F.Ca.IN.020.06.1.1]
MENNRNFFITIALSVLILTLWQVFYMNPKMEQQREQARIEQQRVEAQKKEAQGTNPGAAGTPAPAPGAIPTAPGGETVTVESRDQAVAATKRIKIDTPSLEGSINLTGARLDDLELKHYTETVDKNSPEIQLLNPQALPTGYFAEIGFVGTDKTGAVPSSDTVWSVEGNPTLTPSTPVTLTYTNDKGLTFKRTISVDNDYMFTVSDTVQNSGSAAVSLFNYGRVTRYDKPAVASTYVLHEGLIGVTGTEGLTEYKYAAIEKDKEVKPGKSTDGWLGITDKYWAVTMVPTEKQPFQPRYGYFEDGRHRYQSDFLTDPINIEAGQSATIETEVFAGAKEVAKINAYEADRHIRQFNLLIDWGWFYFITKPMFWLIDTLYKFFGNFGLAILATTVIVKAIFFPLANKSYASMANMKKVQPKMLEIREKYADDKMKQQQAMMELYKTEKINPLAGCWPVALQIPVFFSLYKVLYITIEMRHAPFFGWIHDLAAPDPTSVFNLFGLLPFAPPAFLPHMGAWAVVMGITMFLQMRMNPTPPDPTQAAVFTWMPVLFTFMMGSFPAGLVIYWAWNNLLSILQQGVIMKRQGAKIELWDNLAAMFRKKPSPAE